MLSKRICKDCYVKGCNNADAWDDAVERMWKRGIMWCVEFHEKDRITSYVGETKVNEPPPRWCKYALEHVVSERQDAKG